MKRRVYRFGERHEPPYTLGGRRISPPEACEILHHHHLPLGKSMMMKKIRAPYRSETLWHVLDHYLSEAAFTSHLSATRLPPKLARPLSLLCRNSPFAP